jgi:hypothetical protein
MSPLPSKPGLNVKASPVDDTVEDVDLTTFKPTFVSESKDRRRKRKTKKQKSFKGGTLLSFDIVMDGGESLSLTVAHQKHQNRDSEGPRKKKRKDQ